MGVKSNFFVRGRLMPTVSHPCPPHNSSRCMLWAVKTLTELVWHPRSLQGKCLEQLLESVKCKGKSNHLRRLWKRCVNQVWTGTPIPTPTLRMVSQAPSLREETSTCPQPSSRPRKAPRISAQTTTIQRPTQPSALERSRSPLPPLIPSSPPRRISRFIRRWRAAASEMLAAPRPSTTPLFKVKCKAPSVQAHRG